MPAGEKKKSVGGQEEKTSSVPLGKGERNSRTEVTPSTEMKSKKER